jgi:hypothetical protein
MTTYANGTLRVNGDGGTVAVIRLGDVVYAARVDRNVNVFRRHGDPLTMTFDDAKTAAIVVDEIATRMEKGA